MTANAGPYRHNPDAAGVLDAESRDVIDIKLGSDPGVAFQCPCGTRTVYVTEPPHGIAFDDDGRLTLRGSCGFRAAGNYPANWCHFQITNGIATMYSDAQCPGSDDAT